MEYFKKNNKGQSIIEAMVALSILTVGLLGILSLLSQSFAINRVTSNETTATYLASEGIEVTKNILDHDVYDPANTFGWGTCEGACDRPLGAYTVSYSSLTPTLITDGHCASGLDVPDLLFSSSTDLYGYAAGTPTNFQRCVEMDQITNSSGKIIEVTVKSDVTWVSGSVNGQVNLEDDFYNWHP